LELFAFCVRKSGGREVCLFFSLGIFSGRLAGWQAKRTKKKKIPPVHRTAEGVLTQKKKKAPNTETNTYEYSLARTRSIFYARIITRIS